MTISAKVVADSVSPQGIRLTTMQITLHRYVLAEFNTHRVFSRNFRSSRAVPVAKLLKEVREAPAEPVVWLSNKPGMQGGDPLDSDALDRCRARWLRAAQDAVDAAEELAEAGLHKSWANRVLEPYLYVHGVVTSTEWQNFFALRRHPDAQPEMRTLAEAMWEAREASVPKLLQPGEWHLPYVGEVKCASGIDFRKEPEVDMWRKVSVARCARVSYLTHEGKPPNVEDDLKLYDRLVGATPLHASPAEHQATPDGTVEGIAVSEQDRGWQNPDQHGNLYGWRQYRKMLPNENVKDR